MIFAGLCGQVFADHHLDPQLFLPFVDGDAVGFGAQNAQGRAREVAGILGDDGIQMARHQGLSRVRCKFVPDHHEAAKQAVYRPV